MPSKHKHSAITSRMPTELKDRAQRAVAEMATDLNTLVTDFMRWYVGDINELPGRPTSRIPKPESQPMSQTIECKLCRAERLRHPPFSNLTSDPISDYMHPIEDFGRAYGRNVDSGNDVRSDVCEIYGVNTGPKLKEHGLSWGWLDEETGVRLCCDEEPDLHYSCSRQKFHEGDHRDANGSTWHQCNHFLLSRIEIDGSVRHLGLYSTQPNARVAAFYDFGEKEMEEWMPLEKSFHYLGRLSDRVAYVVTYIDVGDVQAALESVPAALPSSR